MDNPCVYFKIDERMLDSSGCSCKNGNYGEELLDITYTERYGSPDLAYTVKTREGDLDCQTKTLACLGNRNIDLTFYFRHGQEKQFHLNDETPVELIEFLEEYRDNGNEYPEDHPQFDQIVEDSLDI